MHKGECFITKDSSDNDETVLMYSPAELKGLIGTGQFHKLYPTGIKIKGK